MRLVSIALAFGVLLAGAAAAEGCSAAVVPATVAVRASDAIARVRVLGEVPGGESPGRVAVEVLEVLKGRLADRVLTVTGRLTARKPSAERPSPYDQLDCTRAGGCGGCFAYDYILGQEYLFLLKGGTPYWAPLAPANEAISGPGDPWVRWVQEELWRR
jgi:hypothetical protein